MKNLNKVSSNLNDSSSPVRVDETNSDDENSDEDRTVLLA